MRVSKEEIQNINRNRSARNGQIYTSFEGLSFIGTKSGNLAPHVVSIKEKQADRALEARVATNETNIVALKKEDIRLENTKEDTVTVDSKLASLECKLIAMNIVLG